jgi:hypothetical protein
MALICWESFTHDTSFEQIMTWCLEHHAVDRMLLALRRHQVGNKYEYDDLKAAELLHSTFGSYIRTAFPTLEWPGTRASAPAFVYVLNFNEEVKELVLKTEPSLEKWLHLGQSSLPEDPCLFKESDSHPILVTSIHHATAWLLSEKTPDVPGFKKTNFPPDSFFPEGKYFCRKYKKTRR